MTPKATDPPPPLIVTYKGLECKLEIFRSSELGPFIIAIHLIHIDSGDVVKEIDITRQIQWNTQI